ncbi:hypothetical protein HAX54_040158 [Datura stramonium]|uniref:Lipase-like C-terminal domain-containing protein n=1 Tax=Datura stramonium TaxID=4076 RepID=A0ABS8VPR2_DATST|nr:hypothetical protein [Datura stramonium]
MGQSLKDIDGMPLLDSTLLNERGNRLINEELDYDKGALKERLGGLSYFAGAEKKDRRVLLLDLGSFTRILGFRARELFYYLEGGQVDYGEEHNKALCFPSKNEARHYPEWDEDHPIHLVGHSVGAQLLPCEQFLGSGTSAINLIELFSFGVRPEDGKSLMPVCLLQLYRIGVITYEWFDIPWLKDYQNFGFDYYTMTWRKSGIQGLLDCILGNAGLFASGN